MESCCLCKRWVSSHVKSKAGDNCRGLEFLWFLYTLWRWMSSQWPSTFLQTQHLTHLYSVRVWCMKELCASRWLLFHGKSITWHMTQLTGSSGNGSAAFRRGGYKVSALTVKWTAQVLSQASPVFLIHHACVHPSLDQLCVLKLSAIALVLPSPWICSNLCPEQHVSTGEWYLVRPRSLVYLLQPEASSYLLISPKAWVTRPLMSLLPQLLTGTLTSQWDWSPALPLAGCGFCILLLSRLLDPLALVQVAFLEEGVHSQKLWLYFHLSLGPDWGLRIWLGSLPLCIRELTSFALWVLPKEK